MTRPFKTINVSDELNDKIDKLTAKLSKDLGTKMSKAGTIAQALKLLEKEMES